MSFVEDVSGEPEDDAMILAMWRRALAGETFTETCEFVNKKILGRTFEMSFSCFRSEDGSILGASYFSREITARIRAQDERARLIAILESTSDYVATTTVDGQLLYCNRAFRDFLGVTEDQVPTLAAKDVHTPESYDK